MKVVIDARMYGLEYSGIGRYLINLIGHLKKRRLRYEIILLLRRKYYDKIEVPDNWSKVIADYPHYSIAEQFRLSFLLNKISPDLVHFTHFNSCIFWRGKFVVTIHDLTMHTYASMSTVLPKLIFMIKYSAYKYVFKLSVNNSMKIITPSQKVKKDLINYYKINDSKIIKIYEGVSEDFTDDNEKHSTVITDNNDIYTYNKSKYLIYVGNIYPHKNLEQLLYSYKLLIENRFDPPMLVIITKNNNYLNQLKTKAGQLKLEKYIKCLHDVSDGQLYRLYKKSLAFIYPSLSEGFGLPGLEAMSSGTILACSENEEFKEIYKDAPFYFDPKSALSIAEVVKKIISLKKVDRERIIKRSKAVAAQYSWDKMAEDTTKVYESCIGV